MKYCINTGCSEELPDDANFCSRCGKPQNPAPQTTGSREKSGFWSGVARFFEAQTAEPQSSSASQSYSQPASASANFVRIPAGTFRMGSPASEPGRSIDEVQHSVTVSAFSMSKYEVTQKEYQEVMGVNPSAFKGDNLPVECVSWYDAVEYCNKRSQREGLTPAYTISGTNVAWNRSANGYRLPTEAEWEYACRAGTTTPFHTGNNITPSQANYNGNNPYNGNAKGQYRERTWAVGSGEANAWGLYDMHGNVYEWCWNWYGDYSSSSQTNPVGHSAGGGRVIRGGSWSNGGWIVRSAFRNLNGPAARYDHLGFRLVRLESAGKQP